MPRPARTSEQVGYLEKVAKAQEQIVTQSAAITEARLALVGLCQDDAAAVLNEYLRAITALPRSPARPLPVEGAAVYVPTAGTAP